MCMLDTTIHIHTRSVDHRCTAAGENVLDVVLVAVILPFFFISYCVGCLILGVQGQETEHVCLNACKRVIIALKHGC